MGGQQVGVPVVRIVLDADETLGDKVFDVGVDQAERYTQALCKFALGNGLFIHYLGEELEGLVIVRRAAFGSVHILNTTSVFKIIQENFQQFSRTTTEKLFQIAEFFMR